MWNVDLEHTYKKLLKLWLSISTGSKDGKLTNEQCTAMDKFLYGLAVELREKLKEIEPFRERYLPNMPLPEPYEFIKKEFLDE